MPPARSVTAGGVGLLNQPRTAIVSPERPPEHRPPIRSSVMCGRGTHPTGVESEFVPSPSATRRRRLRPVGRRGLPTHPVRRRCARRTEGPCGGLRRRLRGCNPRPADADDVQGVHRVHLLDQCRLLQRHPAGGEQPRWRLHRPGRAQHRHVFGRVHGQAAADRQRHRPG